MLSISFAANIVKVMMMLSTHIIHLSGRRGEPFLSFLWGTGRVLVRVDGQCVGGGGGGGGGGVGGDEAGGQAGRHIGFGRQGGAWGGVLFGEL